MKLYNQSDENEVEIRESVDEEDDITKQLIKQLLADECEHETDLRRIFEGL